MSIVVDASVAVKWVVEEQGSDSASALINRENPPIAPAFLMIESANVLLKKVRRGELNGDQARMGLTFIGKAFPALVPDADLSERAFAIALELSHPIYDCLYLSCAESIKSKLVTADKRLFEKTRASRFGWLVDLLDNEDETRPV